MMSTEDSPLFDQKKTFLQKFLKFVFIVLALFLIGITVLANMGGSNDMLKESLARFTSEMFGGRPVRVVELQRMSFFPTVGVSAKEIQVMNNDKDSYPVFKIGQIQIFMSFWDVAFSRTRVTKLYLENAEAIKGFFFPNELYIERVYIDHDVEKQVANIKANGKVGEYPWSAEIGVSIDGENNKYKYFWSEDVPFLAQINDVTIEGAVAKHESAYLKFSDIKITSPSGTLNGNFILSAIGDQVMKLVAEASTQDQSTQWQSEMIIGLGVFPVKVKGDVILDTIDTKDFDDAGVISGTLNRVLTALGYEKADPFSIWLSSAFSLHDLDLNVGFNNIKLPEESVQNISLNYIQDKGKTKFGAVSQNGEEIFPSVLFVPGEKGLTTLVSKGVIKTDMVKKFVKGLSPQITKKQSINVECGLGEFEFTPEHINVASFDVLLTDGSINMKEKQIQSNQPLKDLTYQYAAQKPEFKTIELNEDINAFVENHFLKNDMMDECRNIPAVVAVQTSPEMTYEPPAEAQE